MSMLQRSRFWRIFTLTGVAGVLFAGLLVASASSVAAENNNPGILPANSSPHGMTYGEWAAEWWTWAISNDFNTILDGTGELCADGQSGHVWFLAGSFGSVETRDCTVPTGQMLFFPIRNNAWFQFPDDPPLDVDGIRALLAAGNDASGAISATVDGVAINNLEQYRTVAPEFNAVVVDDNQFGFPDGSAGQLDDGWYLMLAPLSAGEHTVNFTAQDGDLDVTYNLTIGDDD